MEVMDYKESQVRRVKLEQKVKRVKLEKKEKEAYRENKVHRYYLLLLNNY